MKDFSFQSDDVVAAGRPDLVVLDKKRNFKMIDLAVSRDSRIEKEKEKIEKYQDLRRTLLKFGM